MESWSILHESCLPSSLFCISTFTFTVLKSLMKRISASRVCSNCSNEEHVNFIHLKFQSNAWGTVKKLIISFTRKSADFEINFITWRPSTYYDLVKN